MSRDKDFVGKVISLSGGASGIGLATAKILYARGASIGIGDVDEGALDRTAIMFPDTARVLLKVLDVSKRASVDSWIEAIVRKFGKLDGAANCAGIIGKHHGTRMVEELDDAQWHMLLGVNLTGMMYCLRAQLNAMKGPGSIVCVSSIQGTQGFAKHSAYAASKHGVIGLVRCAAKEVGSRNIRVNAATPGAIQTPLIDQRASLYGVDAALPQTPINRLGHAEEAGNQIAWLLSDEATFVSGAIHAIDVGWAC